MMFYPPVNQIYKKIHIHVVIIGGLERSTRSKESHKGHKPRKYLFCFLLNSITEQCKKIPVRFWELLAEIWRHSAILGWATEHFGGDSRDFAVMFLHNSVEAAKDVSDPISGVNGRIN